MGSKGRALKRRQAGGKRLFQKRRKRFKSSNNDIHSTEVHSTTNNNTKQSCIFITKKVKSKKKHFSLHRIQMKSVIIMTLAIIAFVSGIKSTTQVLVNKLKHQNIL